MANHQLDHYNLFHSHKGDRKVLLLSYVPIHIQLFQAEAGKIRQKSHSSFSFKSLCVFVPLWFKFNEPELFKAFFINRHQH